MNFLDLKKAISVRLVGLGWDRYRDCDLEYTAGVAIKTYNTAVGQKEAVVCLYPYDGNRAFKLTGQYDSEGRNVLGTTWFVVSPDLTTEQLEEGVTEFAKKVEHYVGESYAMRLMRSAPAEISG